MIKVLTARLPDVLVDDVHQIAEARRLSVSEVVRAALVAYLARDPNMLLYEIVKTRALVLRMLDRELTEPEVDELLSLAEADATGYVQERNGEAHG